MRLPNATNAVVSQAKVRDYLLSDEHPIGRFKARFFRSLGYSIDSYDVLVADLKRHAQSPVGRTVSSDFGPKYEVHAELHGPNGTVAWVVSVWIVVPGTEYPRLITAYPKS